MNECTEVLQERMARLRWACRRTQSELNTPLILFLENHYPALIMAQRFAFERLLAASDTEITAWLTDQSQSRDQGINAIVATIRQLIHEQDYEKS